MVPFESFHRSCHCPQSHRRHIYNRHVRRSPQLYSRLRSTSIPSPSSLSKETNRRRNFALDDDIAAVIVFFRCFLWFFIRNSKNIHVYLPLSPHLVEMSELESSTRSSPGSKFFTIICPLFKFITRRDLPTSIGKSVSFLFWGCYICRRAHRPMTNMTRTMQRNTW